MISFLADRRIPVVLFKSRRSSEKCIKKRRNPLYRKDFRVISFLAARYKSLGRFRSDREKTRKAEISRDFSAFFAPNFFQISIDPFSIFFRVEGFEPANPKYCPTEDKEKATATKPWPILFDFNSPTNWNLLV